MEENNNTIVVVVDNDDNVPVKLKEVVKAHENKKKRAAAEVDPTGERENCDQYEPTANGESDDDDNNNDHDQRETKGLPSDDRAVEHDSTDKNVENSPKHNVVELEVANQMMDFLTSPTKESLSQKEAALARQAVVNLNQKENTLPNEKEKTTERAAERPEQDEAVVDHSEETDEPEPSAAAEDETAAAVPLRPIKRARTAYFIFADDKRAEVQKQVRKKDQILC